jgi:hypothetical protein
MILGSKFWKITDERIQKYISEQEGEPVNDEHRFQIDSFKSIAL